MPPRARSAPSMAIVEALEMPTLKQRLEDNFAYVLLAAIFAAILATTGIVAGTLLFFENRIEERAVAIRNDVSERTAGISKDLDEGIKQLRDLIAPTVVTTIRDDTLAKNLVEFQLRAANALHAAERQQEAALAAQQDAERHARDLMRQSDEMKARLASLDAELNVAAVSERVDAAVNDQSFIEAVSKHLLPSGSVVPFDLSSGCPDGWDPFKPIVGRTIVGAGEATNADEVGVPLSSHKQGQAGGREAYKLTIENVPQHQHATQAGVLAGNAVWGTGGSGLIVAGASMGNAFFSNTSPVGEQDPNAIPLMPPYLAMIYCRRN